MTPFPKLLLLLLTCTVLLGIAESDILTRRDCGRKKHIENGYVDFTGADTSLEAPVICKTGYKKATHGKIFCQADGTWTNETCKPKDCKKTYTVKKGTVNYVNTTYNEIATVTCNLGYEIKGHKFLICLATGRWNTNLTCEKIDCKQNYTVKDGYVNFQGYETTYLKEFPVSCRPGYIPVGDRNTTCQADGTWSTGTACKPIDCGTIHELEHGYANFSGQNTTYDSRIPVYCRKGYFREGNDFLRCTENGTWSNDTQCHIVQCGTNHTVAHSQANFTERTQFHYGTVVPIYCDKGYEIDGNNFAVCQEDGTWSKTRCRKKVQSARCIINNCGKSYYIENGWINFEGRTSTYNSKLPVECDKGYKVLGEKYITCLSNGKWSSMSFCVVEKCPTIYHLDNGYVDFFEKDIAYKAIVPIECDFGYFPTGRMEIECQKNGVWSKSECVNEILRDENIAIIAGSVAGVVMLTIVIIIIVLKLKKKLCFAAEK